MNWKRTKKKLWLGILRIIGRIRRIFRKIPGASITERRKAINRSVDDFNNMFSPKICYILCVKKGKNKSFMAPIKAITEINYYPHRIVFSVIRGSEAAKYLIKNKCFTISQVPREYGRDFARMVEALPAKGTINAVMRFRAEPAFFIPGYKVQNLPWAEYKMNRGSVINVDKETTLIVGEVVHISKKQNSDREKLIHKSGKLFVNTKTLSIKNIDKIRL